MHVGIAASSPENVEVQDLAHELDQRSIPYTIFSLQHLATRSGSGTDFKIQTQTGVILTDMEAILVRGIGSATVAYPKIFFRMDTLYALERAGVIVLNTPRSIEYSTDKFFTSIILAQQNIPTPRTHVVENFTAACAAFDALGGDVVIKPIYGAMGIGMMRVADRGYAERVFMKLDELNEVYYLQEFVEHHDQDIRVVTIGGQVVAGMYRVGTSWKTNIHAGAEPQPIDISPDIMELVIKAAEVTEVEVCGVDILETEQGLTVIEVNSIPGLARPTSCCGEYTRSRGGIFIAENCRILIWETFPGRDHNMEEMEEKRQRIDEIDQELIRLINERAIISARNWHVETRRPVLGSWTRTGKSG